MTHQTHKSNQIVKAALISALIVIGGGASLAGASPDRDRGYGGYDRGGHRHTELCRHDYWQTAGWLKIDGYSTRIRSDHPMLRQIVRAFRDAGYHAWISNGCVQVDYGRYRPHVRWRQDRYRARFDWDNSYGELSISLRRAHSYRKAHRAKRRFGHGARRAIGWGYCD